MPEGPEVKLVSDYVNKQLKNRSITRLECISSPYRLKYSNIIKAVNKFLPVKFVKSFCRGKNTFISLGNNEYLAYHLGMTGYWSTIQKKHAHLKLIAGKKTLFFHDTRRFGNIKIVNTKLINKKFDIRLDLLNNSGSLKLQVDFITSLIHTKREVCKVLLDQRFFLGVGNYLKSEILYRSMIHPHTCWSKLKLEEKKIICINTRRIMLKSYLSGGAQLRDFKNPNFGSSLKLDVYQRKTTDDGKIVVSDITLDKRVTYWCPEMQKIRK